MLIRDKVSGGGSTSCETMLLRSQDAQKPIRSRTRDSNTLPIAGCITIGLKWMHCTVLCKYTTKIYYNGFPYGFLGGAQVHIIQLGKQFTVVSHSPTFWKQNVDTQCLSNSVLGPILNQQEQAKYFVCYHRFVTDQPTYYILVKRFSPK